MSNNDSAKPAGREEGEGVEAEKELRRAREH